MWRLNNGVALEWKRAPLTSPSTLPNGYFVLPPGKLANAVTWLELLKSRRPPSPEPLRLVAAEAAERNASRDLFAEVGTPWLWSRAHDEEGSSPGLLFFACDEQDRRVGLAELSVQEGDSIEISYFGLVPTATGKGLGRRMMAAVLDRCWPTADRVWLHTCNFDHPGALRFYRSCGFVPYATGYEIMDDPRLAGLLPRSAAPHVPLIG